MEREPTDYRSYLLRLWRTRPDGAWRASLEDPRTGERIGFTSLDALLEHLRQLTDQPVPHGLKDELQDTATEEE